MKLFNPCLNYVTSVMTFKQEEITLLTSFTLAFILSSLTCQLMAPFWWRNYEGNILPGCLQGEYNCCCSVLKRLFKCFSVIVIGFPPLLPFALSQCFPCHSKHEEAFSQAWNSFQNNKLIRAPPVMDGCEMVRDVSLRSTRHPDRVTIICLILMT